MNFGQTCRTVVPTQFSICSSPSVAAAWFFKWILPVCFCSVLKRNSIITLSTDLSFYLQLQHQLQLLLSPSLGTFLLLGFGFGFVFGFGFLAMPEWFGFISLAFGFLLESTLSSLSFSLLLLLSSHRGVAWADIVAAFVDILNLRQLHKKMLHNYLPRLVALVSTKISISMDDLAEHIRQQQKQQQQRRFEFDFIFMLWPVELRLMLSIARTMPGNKHWQQKQHFKHNTVNWQQQHLIKNNNNCYL